MKRLTTLLFVVLITISAFSQAPEKMSYQAVIRDAGGELIKSQTVGLQISILQGSFDGSAVYSEIQTPVTNANGLVSVEIGSEAGFSAIDWSAGPYFIKTEIATEAPLTNYTITGTSQVLSVPYAIAASTFDKLTSRRTSVCDESTEGAMRYNPDTRSVEYCNGYNWITLSNGLTISLPTVSTSSVSSITATSAQSGGSISDNGGAEIKQKGVCWNTETLPTIDNGKTLQGTGSTSFVSNLTDLVNNTLYFTRAYATNTSGTGYGDESEFTTLASLTTTQASDNTLFSFITGGDIETGGGQAISERGVVYGTSADPTILDNKVIASEPGTGRFSVTLDGLTNKTNNYYYKAYALNSGGVSYGNEYSSGYFDIAGEGFTDSRDGNSYATVWIGGKEWMAENLKYLPSVVGSATGSETTPYYYVYGYDGTNVTVAKATANYDTYGVLYNWSAALNACPTGWHLPIDAEWTDMQNYLIAYGYNYDGTTSGNKIAKALATATGWKIYENVGAVGNPDYPEKQNATGFSALPGGNRISYGSFYDVGYYGYWWSATEYGSTRAWLRHLSNYYSNLFRYEYRKEFGISVRCLRDN